jgi:hypothetical protein
MYGTVAKADTFMADYDFQATWNTYTTSQKTKALKKATKQIDSLRFDGRKVSFTQELEFPRYRNDAIFKYRFDLGISTEIPTDVEEATYIQAKFLLDTVDNCVIQALHSGITQLSIGRTSQTIDKALLPVNLENGLCTEAYNKLKKYLIHAI